MTASLVLRRQRRLQKGRAPLLEEAGVESRIELTIGPALATLDWLLAQGLTEQLDLAFIDANKEEYDAYYERCLKLIRRGGLVLIDLALFAGGDGMTCELKR